MFVTRHLIALAVCITAGILMCVFLRRLEITKWFRLLLCVGIVSETVKVFYYILANEDVYGGYLPKTDLPFHLCSVQLIFIAVLICAVPLIVLYIFTQRTFVESLAMTGSKE